MLKTKQMPKNTKKKLKYIYLNLNNINLVDFAFIFGNLTSYKKIKNQSNQSLYTADILKCFYLVHYYILYYTKFI